MTNIHAKQAQNEFQAVEKRYVDALTERGLKFASTNRQNVLSDLRAQLVKAGATIRNGGASISVGFLSPACVACTDNVLSETFSTTFKCHRDCYFCFNKNQPDYEHFFNCGCPWEERIEEVYSQYGNNYKCIALSGGEPLLNFDETVRFFELAKEKFPDAHKRMYTSGDLLTEDMAKKLADLGLDEIRFSVKDDDSKEMRQSVLESMRIAKKYIPSLMVEMPIIPNAEDHMKSLFKDFQEIGIDGINLLEFCFPFNNWQDYENRGFELKNPPFDVMYDYGYSGGLAVDKSEELILRLMLWAINEGMTFGMHYCSLDNKHRSEIRIKNERFASLGDELLTLDPEDFFLKAAKVYDDDIDYVKSTLENIGCRTYKLDAEEHSLTFPLSLVKKVNDLALSDSKDLEIYECFYVYEEDDEGGFIIDTALRPIIA